MRNPTDFIIWNHIFMMYEVYRCIDAKEYMLLLLGGITSILSIICHLYNEKKCDNIEGIIAKTTQIYIIISSLYYFNIYQILLIIFFNMCLYTLWKFSNKIDYEQIHPWLHIIVAINAHYYINFYKKLYN